MPKLHYEQGEVIFRQGYPSDHAYVIESGQVEIYHEDGQGGESRVATLGPGQMFGEYGVLDDAPRSASARALEPVQLRVMPL